MKKVNIQYFCDCCGEKITDEVKAIMTGKVNPGDDAFTRFKRNKVQIRRKVITTGDLTQVVLPEGVNSFILDPDSAKLLIQLKKKNS